MTSVTAVLCEPMPLYQTIVFYPFGIVKWITNTSETLSMGSLSFALYYRKTISTAILVAASMAGVSGYV